MAESPEVRRHRLLLDDASFAPHGGDLRNTGNRRMAEEEEEDEANLPPGARGKKLGGGKDDGLPPSVVCDSVSAFLSAVKPRPWNCQWCCYCDDF